MTTKDDRDSERYGAFLDRVIAAVSKGDPPVTPKKPWQVSLPDHHPDSPLYQPRPLPDAQVTGVNQASATRSDNRAQAFMRALPERQREQAALRERRREATLYADAFSRYIRSGPEQMGDEQRAVLQTGFRRPPDQRETRDLGVASGGVGGYLVPQAFYDRIVRAQKLLGGMRVAAYTYRTTTGATMPVPMDNDTANVGELISENTITTSQDTTLTSKSLGAYFYSSKVIKVALQLTQDFAFDIDMWLAEKTGHKARPHPEPALHHGNRLGTAPGCGHRRHPG
jgi:HK97 family phage major capsid protein